MREASIFLWRGKEEIFFSSLFVFQGRAYADGDDEYFLTCYDEE